MFIYDIYIYVYLILYAHITLYYHVKTVYTMDCLWFRSQYWAACRTLIAHRRQRPPVRWRPGWNMVKRVSFQGGATNQKSSEIKHKKTMIWPLWRPLYTTEIQVVRLFTAANTQCPAFKPDGMDFRLHGCQLNNGPPDGACEPARDGLQRLKAVWMPG